MSAVPGSKKKKQTKKQKTAASSTHLLFSQVLCQSVAIKCWKQGENALIIFLRRLCAIKVKHKPPFVVGQLQGSFTYAPFALFGIHFLEWPLHAYFWYGQRMGKEDEEPRNAATAASVL